MAAEIGLPVSERTHVDETHGRDGLSMDSSFFGDFGVTFAILVMALSALTLAVLLALVFCKRV